MNTVSSFFNSRGLFYNKHALGDSTLAENTIKKIVGEGDYAPISKALLDLGSALFCYNAYTRFYTQRFVAIENCISGFNKMIYHSSTSLENKEYDGLIYTAFWLAGYQQLGQALAVARDLLEILPTSPTWPNFNTALQICYDLIYLGLFFTPQGHSLILLLKVSKVAYFAFKEYSSCSASWNKMQLTIRAPTFVHAIHLLANGIRLCGNSLQLYTQAMPLLK